MSRGPRVLVFDSGIGGLSIATSLGKRLRDWQLVYVADNAFFPYGDQAESLVIDRCATLISSVMAETPIDMVVVGCNTASTVVLPALRAILTCPVVGVVPAIKPAAALSRNRRIGLLATPATIQRPYLDQLIAEFASDCTVTRIGSSELVRLAERWMGTGEIALGDCQRILRPFAEAEVDTVVLGCTHFPLIRYLLEPVLGPGVGWVDSGEAIARRLEALWQQSAAGGLGRAEQADPVEFSFYFTGLEPPGIRSYLAATGWPPARIRPEYVPSAPDSARGLARGVQGAG
ncbi:glutamate racemase [Hydrocarboniclastica marina]|uniref:Glutamate racemase n=1 Tax=Hydrocarboniclastica marina TaxID=2259620 RepID=A0A4P7XFF2_9ALTE|nr:glutamate racemase [Hydrocarboniclastica marina]QCF25313.1 glutamate racemase [Hydrocarboniclastica marina]